jgi:hypothetical protein
MRASQTKLAVPNPYTLRPLTYICALRMQELQSRCRGGRLPLAHHRLHFQREASAEYERALVSRRKNQTGSLTRQQSQWRDGVQQLLSKTSSHLGGRRAGMDMMTVASLSLSFSSGARNAHTCARSNIVSEEIEFYRRREKMSRRQTHADVRRDNPVHAALS